MRFKIYQENGALNSTPVFAAFSAGLKKLGHSIVDKDEDVGVIWSVLWQGRMQPNKLIYENAIKNNRPIIIIEVGNLKRGVTWRIGLNHINNFGIFGNQQDLDLARPQILGISLRSMNQHRRQEILIACQHSASLQWNNQPSMEQWVKQTIIEIKKYTDRKIVVRSHPRSQIREKFMDAVVETPKKIQGSYDDFDINYNYHCVINHNSGPGVQAAVNGIPVICNSSSLAYPVSEKWKNLENPQLPDRDDWFLKLCHTEWTVEEIGQGTPILRLQTHIEHLLHAHS
jgi:hypothetical protein